MKKILAIATVLFGLTFVTQCSSDNPQYVEFKGESIDVTLSNATESVGGNSATVSGKLVSKNSVNVSTRMMGYITSMPVKVGQSVKSGQLLLTISNADIQAKGGQVDAQILQAQAAHDVAKKDYERFKNLYQTQSATQKELDDMKARYDMAAANLQAAIQMKNEVNAQYKYTNITAPVSGVITSKFAEQGDMANPGMPLLTIESPSVLQAQVMVPENLIADLKNDMNVQVQIKSSGEMLNGKVAEISQSSTHTGGQYWVKINIEESENLRPGMFVNARFFIENHSDENKETKHILIPKSALVKKGQLSGVYTVSSQNTAVLRWLKLGKETADEVEVLSGLTADEKFVVKANGRLYNGAKLNAN